LKGAITGGKSINRPSGVPTCEFASDRVPQSDLDAHYRVNAMIMARVKSRSVSYETLVGNLEASMAADDGQTPAS
jgi:hypothetical protein